MDLSPFHQKLISWFQNQKRDLPWRHQPSPYSVWVSEVMLQQTQVAVVLPYFLRWMERFPTVSHLAEASLDEVIKLWEGLGYYSRARNLHEGANYIVKELAGKFPEKPEELAKIKGLGPYTIGAIRNFAFHQRAPIVDGNVIRVLSRCFLIEEDISKPKTIAKIWKLAEEILPEEKAWVFNEGLMELGATLCKKNPQCTECPLKHHCQAYLRGKTNQIPYKSAKIKVETLHRTIAVIFSGNHLLLRKGEQGKIMGDLHEFPYFETDGQEMTETYLIKKIREEWRLKVISQGILPKVSHSFTRYQAHLYPVLLKAENLQPQESFQWISWEKIETLAFSSGHRRVLEHFKESYAHLTHRSI